MPAPVQNMCVHRRSHVFVTKFLDRTDVISILKKERRKGISYFTIQNVSIKKKEPTQHLVFRQCADMFFYSQMGQELVHLWFGHLRWMPHMMEKDVRNGPMGTIFSGALVPVIPLPQNPFETSGRNLQTHVMRNQAPEKLKQ